MEAMKPCARLLVTDLDNTLYDWFDIWHSSFSALLEEVAKISGLPVEVLEFNARDVHQRHRTSEYTFLLNEMECLRALHSEKEIAEVYAEAIQRFQSARRQATSLYPTVGETLREIQHLGVPVVGYTDSLAFHSLKRIKALGLDGVITAMYSPPDHRMPDGLDLAEIRSKDPSEYEFDHTVPRELPLGAAKPDPAVLKQICADFRVSPEETVYVGDSPMKDIAMAQAIGAIDVLAEYGISVNREGYELLRRVSHWAQADIERERQLAANRTVVPRHVLKEQFAELLDIVEFVGESE